jgi:hypothetical protein
MFWPPSAPFLIRGFFSKRKKEAPLQGEFNWIANIGEDPDEGFDHK